MISPLEENQVHELLAEATRERDLAIADLTAALEHGSPQRLMSWLWLYDMEKANELELATQFWPKETWDASKDQKLMQHRIQRVRKTVLTIFDLKTHGD